MTNQGKPVLSLPQGSVKTPTNQAAAAPTSPASKHNNKAPLLKIGAVFGGLVALLLLANFAVPRVLVMLTRATRHSQYSPANSYIFAAPIMAKADGQQKIQVNVFLLDSRGYGVPQKRVDLTVSRDDQGQTNVNGSPQIRAVRPLTDEKGQATFEIVSRVPGNYKISASSDGIPISQSVHVSFLAAD